jgi:hypothetical protein
LPSTVCPQLTRPAHVSKLHADRATADALRRKIAGEEGAIAHNAGPPPSPRQKKEEETDVAGNKIALAALERSLNERQADLGDWRGVFGNFIFKPQRPFTFGELALIEEGSKRSLSVITSLAVRVSTIS